MQCEKCLYSENKMCGYGKKPKKAISIEIEVEPENEMGTSVEMDMIHKLAMVLAEDNRCPFYDEMEMVVDEELEEEPLMLPITWLN